MDDEQRQALWDDMMLKEGPDCIFELQKMKDEVDKTFSSSAMDLIFDQVKLWVGTRIMLAWTKNVIAPSKLKITVHVDVI